MKGRIGHTAITFVLGLGLITALLWLLGMLTAERPPPIAYAAGRSMPVQAVPGVYCVTPQGGTYPGCTQVLTTIQAAVDAASDGQVIKVAAGTYADVHARPRRDAVSTGVVTQVVYISKTVAIRGGYTTTNWATPYPITQPTVLDAGRKGRGIYVTGEISPVLEGLHITGGDAAGLGGVGAEVSAGGGIYVVSGTTAIHNSFLVSNTSDMGGGIWASGAAITVGHTTIASNTAESGGGLVLYASRILLEGNIIRANRAYYDGGGVRVSSSSVTMTGNVVTANTLSASSQGGGMRVDCSDAAIISNTFAANTILSYGGGGGLAVNDSGGCDYQQEVTVRGNLFTANTAGEGGGLYLSSVGALVEGNTFAGNAGMLGGGIFLIGDGTLDGNAITGNSAAWGAGGLYMRAGHAVLSGNVVLSNTTPGVGGGLIVDDRVSGTWANNLVAGNRAEGAGGGLYIQGASCRLLHTTIARNTSGDGSGIYVGSIPSYAGSVALTNTILVGHTTGITVAAGNTATLEATLWGAGTWANGTDWGGTGTIVTGTRNDWADPAFADPGAGYHLGAGSAAIDAGVNAGIDVDLDGERRPAGQGYDLGADEFVPVLQVSKHADPLVVQAGEPLTYTIDVTNTGDVTLTLMVTDLLPAHTTHPTATGVLTWMPVPVAPHETWTAQVIVTGDLGYSGTLVNEVEATSIDGTRATHVAFSQSKVTPTLSVSKRAEPDPVQVGEVLTYTICVTNTGSVALHAIVTDVLPAQVVYVTTGGHTWTTGAIQPGATWTETVSGTVQTGYVGVLANVVQVTTEEGVTAACTRTTTVEPRRIYLPFIR